MALLHKCKDRAKGEKVYMTRGDFLYLGVYKPGTKVGLDQFERDLVSTLDKCGSLRLHEVSVWAGTIPKKGVIIPLFGKIEYDLTGDWLLEFTVSDEARPYLSGLISDFTRFFLKDFQALDSKYQQDLFRCLVQFRRTGWWRVRREDFIKLLGIPKSYREYDIDRRIIKPAIEKLCGLFLNLECHKIEIKGSRGRKIGTYEFTWTPIKEDNADLNLVYPATSVLGEFEVEFQREFTRAEEVLIHRLEKQYGPVALMYALDEAAVNDRRDFTFIENVLWAWKQSGLSDEDLTKGKR